MPYTHHTDTNHSSKLSIHSLWRPGVIIRERGGGTKRKEGAQRRREGAQRREGTQRRREGAQRREGTQRRREEATEEREGDTGEE